MTRRKGAGLAAAALLVVLQLLLLRAAAQFFDADPPLGLTLAEPLTAEQAAAARSWEQSDANAAGLTASFWNQEKTAVTTDFGRAAQDVDCIGFDGNAQDCLPARYLQGAAPGAAGQQCAVSSALAWALFGSYDIVGQCLTLDGTLYFVSGVFESEASCLLYPAQGDFTHAELRGTSPDTPKADAEQWAAAAGAGKIQSVDYRPQKAWLGRCLCRLPTVLEGLCLLIALLRFLSGLPGLLRGAAWFVLTLIFAWRLPYFLQTLPGWLIPSRWSNFSFWTDLWREITQNRSLS